MRTRETIEAQSLGSAKETAKTTRRGTNPRSLSNLVAPWQPGQSGNPSGRPKKDWSQIIAQQVFENNPELLYKAYSAALAKGQAFAFQVLSDRAYGKLKEKLELSGTDEIANMLEKARQRAKK